MAVSKNMPAYLAKRAQCGEELGAATRNGSRAPIFRFDRLASVYLFHPLQRLRLRQIRIPILMYHRVTELDDCTRHPYYCTNTVVPVFERQMRFLKEKGYRSVGLAEAFSATRAAATSEKLVAITFDDGYRDFYTSAFPILSRYGYCATVFLPTAYIGNSPVRFKGSECMTWNQIRELRKTGVEFGSHTVTHPQLRDVTPRQLEQEIAVSKKQIEQQLGQPVQTFSYPYAFPETDRTFIVGLRKLLEESGYQYGVSTTIGRVSHSDNRFCMSRLPVNTHDDLRLFQTKLLGGYDWLHAVQRAAKLTFTRRALSQP